MGYPQENLIGSLDGLNTTTFSTAQNLTSAATVWGAAIAHYPIMVQRMSFRVSTAISDLTSSVIAMQKVTVGSVTSEITTITVPNSTALGKIMVKDCAPVKIGIGDKLQFKLKTQGGLGGTPAGAGYIGFLAALQPEDYSNETNAVASV